MKQTTLTNRANHLAWLRIVMMTALLLFSGWAYEASARDCYLEDTWRYTVNLEGTNQLRLKMPLYDKDDYDCWIVEGTVFIQIEGQNAETLFYYESQKDIDRDDYLPRIYCYKGVDGAMTLYRDRGYSAVSVGSSKGNELCPCLDNQDYAIVNLLWDIPNKYRGKKVTIKWSIHHNGTSAFEEDHWLAIDNTTITIPSAPPLQQPMVMDPIISFEAGRPNQMMVPYMIATSNLQSMTAYYTEVRGKSSTKKTLELGLSTSDFVWLPADICVKDFYIKAVYVDNEDHVQTTESSMKDLPIIHHPKRLSVSMQPKGNVLITWGISNANWSELSASDTWEVQRNVTGDPTNDQWTGVGHIAYDKKATEYSYEDKGLIYVYQDKDVYYRVRRAVTAVWDWGMQSGYAMTKLPATLALPSISQASVSRNGNWTDASHMVTVNFGIGARANFDKEGRYILNSRKDWENFASLVNGGRTTLNAIMNADIDLGNSQTTVGTNLTAYNGTFDGNGHTLTVHYDKTDNASPFSYIKSPTIKNLHVTGTIKTTGKFASGVASWVIGEIGSIINCRSSVTIESMVNGDATNGGLVGVIEQNCGLTIKDCLFDGSIIGSNCHSNSGFVGFAYDYAALTMVHCLFAPKEMNTKTDGCATFCRNKTNETAQNYYTQTYGTAQGIPAVDMTADNLAKVLGDQWTVQGTSAVPLTATSQIVPNEGKYDEQNRFVLRDSTDWKTFIKLVEEAKGEKDVNAIMASDISTVYPVSLQNDAYYRGTFDGNGHTLTVSINGGEVPFVAPFSKVNTCTIKNLRVCGTVIGGIHSAGLVGTSYNNSTVTIENCHISTHITGTGNKTDPPHLGGIVGHGKNANKIIRNCLFDGSITGVIDEEHGMTKSYAGAFVGWEDGGATNVVENCLEQGTYTNINHVGANYKANDTETDGGSYWGGSNNYNSNDWNECNKTNGMTASELAKALGDNQWQVCGSNVLPIMNVSKDTYHKNILWDNRAKVVLNIEKTVDGEVRYTERREVSDDEREAGKINLDLKTSCVDHRFSMFIEGGESNLPLSYEGSIAVSKTETGEKSIYKFDNNVVIGNIEADTLQNAVSLAWECTRGQADFYRIKRYDKLTPDKVELLEDNYTQTAYIDRSARPQHSYMYIIEGVTRCEGENVSRGQKEGACCPTGMVRGYVRLANGIGLPGYTVTATPVGNIKGAEVLTCETDSTGYFEIGGLIYQKSGEYTLTVTDPTHQASFTAQSIKFDEDVNLQTNIVFTQTNYYIFSGYVLYDGSSIPVSGVRFLRDGVEVVNSNGKPVTTNNQGAFEVSVPQGSHQIQVVKDGHVFLNDGYFITSGAQPDSTWHDWQKNVSEIYLWDKTKVNLQGRVVGGNDQGLMPLGGSLSKNNLGDSITIVLQLEGDNTSWIVRDQQNSTVTERHDKYTHGKNDITQVDAYRHRIVIHPDPETGEYQLPLYPVKYKVTEIYAKGYPTLFQTGMVSETVDLNGYANGDTATYSRIYHSQPTLDIWQFNGTQERYYGLRKYTSMDNVGTRDTVYLWKDDKYSLGYPVFMAGATVPMMLSAREEYRYNNEELGELDVVQLDSGMVYVSNGLVGNDTTDVVELDNAGQATYVFTPQNTTFTLEGDMALRKMSFTLLYDGSYYDIEPIQAYVMAALSKPQGRRIIAGQNTHLVDILRDPPGSNSSAYIEKGTHFNYSYTADYSVQMGINISLGLGEGNEYFTGFWGGAAGGTTAGSINSSDNYGTLSWDLSTTHYEDWEYNYDFETTERISTSESEREVGANSDLYIGMTDNIIVEDAIAVRVVNSKTLQRLKPGIGGTTEVNGHTFNVTGTAKVLASGWDSENKDSIYLIRDEVLQTSSKINSTFIHSQGYLLNELIPDLIRTRNALLMDSTTTSTYAQAMANNLKQPVYVSKVAPDNDNFSAYPYYTIYKPAGITEQWTDSIQALNSQIQTWVGMIATNEKEKLEATDMAKIYNFDGASNIDYSEAFSTSADLHRYWSWPSAVNLTAEDGFNVKTGSDDVNDRVNREYGTDDEITRVEYQVLGLRLSLNITPLFGFDFNYMNGVDSTYTKETGFTLACSRKSNLSVAVYRVREVSEDDLKKLYTVGDFGLYYQNVEQNLKKIYNGVHGGNITSYINGLNKVPRYRNFVFRTLGGATASPWEDERRTIFYNPGMMLDQKTMQINQLRIWAKQSSVSNVPYGEPARFTIYMTNESEFPERVTKELKYYLEDGSNSKGAKVLIDGCPLTGSGQDLWLEPNTIIEKQVEVYAGAEYDYEDIGISFMDEIDVDYVQTVTISAHFVPAAGAVNISKPGDKWVVNTESAYDEEQLAYYLPVHIDGFDVNFPNFDHIELQYKLSTQGDKDWVNVCSYYRNDEEGKRLMELASGKRKLMEHDGYIDAAFYGEKDPIEQYYDIRAVTYCRHSNGYLTRSSNILSGIKDTRRPQLFGTPQPVDGILDIGDDIILRFSEPIAGNYLSPVNNFEVIGQTNSSNISLSSSLHFNGNSLTMAQASRNLAEKSFTVDVMLNPSDNGKAMSILGHGEDEHRMTLGLTADHRLMAVLKDSEKDAPAVFTATEPCKFDGLHEVFYIFECDIEKGTTTVTFYDGTAKVGSFLYPHLYEGYGNIFLGSGDEALAGTEGYEGDMLEFRLWNRALSESEMNNYRQKRLTGYELGLLDNYPLNEGENEICYNRTEGGSDMLLFGTSWKMPDGIGMKLDGEKGFRLDHKPFHRFDHEDYTLMFWFRTTDKKGTLLSNGQGMTETDAKSHFNFNIQDGLFNLNLSGLKLQTQTFASDGSWHHVALTVNRPRNVGCLYFDYNLTNTFAVDTLGGISGNLLAAGATYLTASTVENPISGNIDEIAMYEMALPENGIRSFSSITPTGKEMGLMAYLNFSQNERQQQNNIRLMPSGVSLRRYKDTTTGEWTNQRDTIVAQTDIDRLYDRVVYAPMHDSQTQENIKFSYVADGKDLLINLDVPDASIEKTNVFIVVKDVADLQGNLMASPAVMELYVYRNPLRWTDKHLQLQTYYGNDFTFEATVKNLSGRTKRYTIEGLPVWMTTSETSSSISALDEETITFNVSPYTNIGNYEETVYLVGDDGMSEPLPISLKVRGKAPDWAVDDDLLHTNISMSLIGQVKIDGNVARDSEDLLAVFNEEHRLLGVAHLTSSGTNANDGLAYLNIYNNSYEEIPLFFEFYDASTGIIHNVLPTDDITFNNDTVVGTTKDPVEFGSNSGVVQSIQLKKGWNWVSFNVKPPTSSTVKHLLNNATKWQVGDALEAERPDGTFSLLSYKSSPDPNDPNASIYAWDCADSIVTIDSRKMYRFYSNDEKVGYIAGVTPYDYITVRKGWNRIGFISNLNLPLGTALAEYTENGSAGDIIKSQSEFAILTVDASGNKSWKGTLEYMRVGEGYMLKRNQDSEVNFSYPIYFSGSRYGGNRGAHRASAYENMSGTSMTMVAVADGVEVLPGDRLTAYRDAEVCGIAEADEQGVFYLNVGGGDNSKLSTPNSSLSFTLERDDEILAITTHSQMRYVSDAAFGTPDEPTAISFLSAEQMKTDGWYTLNGVKLDKRPTRRGVYIHNNEKVTIK